MLPAEWSDDNPFFLLLFLSEGRIVVDLGEKGWIARLGERMREPGTWHLCRKPEEGSDDISVAFSMAVLPGEQPFYVARHIGKASGADVNEVVCYGMGKKRLDGHTDRAWVMPNNQIVIGDDAELFARGMIGNG